jgi:acylpyruvate hydrolase
VSGLLFEAQAAGVLALVPDPTRGGDVKDILADRWLARAATDDGPVVVLGGLEGTCVATVGGRTFADLPELITAAGADWDRIEAGDAIELSREQLLTPVADPRKVLCVGANYKAHADEANIDAPAHPMIFAKWPSALTGPFDDVGLPPESQFVDWEAELVVVIGRRSRRVARADVESVLFGYTIANDVSMRDFQIHTSEFEAGKGWDRATPVGPIVVPASAVGGAHPDLALAGRLNGELVQEARTSELIHDVPKVVEYITTWTTLEPGDLILTGTCSGVGALMKPPRPLTDGDAYEVSIEGIGTLSTAFHPEVLASSPAAADRKTVITRS